MNWGEFRQKKHAKCYSDAALLILRVGRRDAGQVRRRWHRLAQWILGGTNDMAEILIILLLVAVVVLFSKHSTLTKRTERLERMVQRLVAGGQSTDPEPQDRAAPEPAATPSPAGQPDKAAPQPVAAKVQQAQVKSDDPAPRETESYVFSARRLGAALGWAQQNWFYLVAAASLGLAGVFFVQYGIENGYLSPPVRVLFALGFGAILIAFGEYLRRRGGDGADDLFAYLPSTFAAGGLVSLFAAFVSAHVLYRLIGPTPALAGLTAVAALAMLIGWFYGPLLAAMGILAGMMAPFLVDGDPSAGWMLYYYFALIAVAAMAVDALRRWAWLSGFAAILAFLAAGMVFSASEAGLHFLIFALILTTAAVVIPERRLIPQHEGAMVVEDVFRLGAEKRIASQFPTRFAAAVLTGATVVVFWVQGGAVSMFWPGFVGLLILLAMTTAWMRAATALADLSLVPLAGLAGLVTAEAGLHRVIWQGWTDAAQRLPETDPPLTVLILLGVAVVVSLVLAWRSARGAPYPVAWAIAAAAFTPLMAVVLEMLWAPSPVIGDLKWAVYVIAAAAVMVGLAERFVRRDGDARQRPALFTLSALTLIALALMVALTASALTVALAVMVPAAVMLDRRYNMPYLALFVMAGTVVVGWRLVIDPGLNWAIDAPLAELILTNGATLVLLGLSWLALRPGARIKSFALVDTVLWTGLAVFASVLIWRLIDLLAPNHNDSTAMVSLMALVWLVSAANQLWRLRSGGIARWIRIVLAVFYGGTGLVLVLVTMTILNPLTGYGGPVFGPYIIDTLFVSFALTAALFLAVAIRFDHLAKLLRYGFAGFGGLLAAMYVGFEIRRLARGNDLSVTGVTDGELYAYTVAMLVISTSLLFYAFWRHSKWLRKLALVGIGLTVAKVFLIDVSGLTGLTRVFSFLVLGLSLAGLAWLDRWFGARDAPSPRETDEKAG